MKYKPLTDPEEVLEKGDEFITKERLYGTEKPNWQEDTYSIGHKISKYPTYCFRRPIKEPPSLFLNRDYIAEVTPESVKVGCRFFTHEKVLELAELVKKVRKDHGLDK